MDAKELYIQAGGARLHAKLGLPSGHEAVCPLVIIVHGYTGDMEEPHIAGLSQALTENGFAALRVEMYGHGQSEGAFRDHTILKWITELLDVIDYARGLGFVSDLYLCGHSQGGLTVMLAAALKADVIKALIPLSPAVSIRDDALAGHIFGTVFDPEHVPDELVFSDGRVLGGNHIRVSQMLPVEEAVQRYRRPVLIVHGDCDESVPYSCAVNLQKQYADCELKTVRDANHCFDDHLGELFDAVVGFLKKQA